MKKIKYVIGSLIITVIFSCNNDDSKQVFNQSALERLKSRIQEDQNILTSAENGWVTSYRPDKDFGYFNLWFQFNKDGTVHTLSDIPLVNDGNWRGGIFAPQPGFYKDTTTHYRISSQHSVDLVFEDPMALHYLYSLTNSSGQKFKSGAEFEFYIIRATPEEVVLESKTDSGKGKQQKTQIILKKATPEDKQNVEKSYAEWEKLSNMNVPFYIFTNDNMDDFIKISIEKRTAVGEEKFPITEVFPPYQIKVKKEGENERTYSMLIIENHSMIIIPKGGQGQLSVIKFAATGKTIDPDKITLEGVNKNQVGVYDAVLHIGKLALYKKTVVYDPSIVGKDITGSYYDIKRTERTGSISLVEGTKSIFLASDFGFYGIFPVYFQMNGSNASVIPQRFAFSSVQSVDLTYDVSARRFTVNIKDQRYDYTIHYTFQMN